SRILRELRRSGHVASALVTQSGPGISYVLTGPEQDATAELVSRAAQTAQQALETLARLNRSLLRELGRKATLRIGIAVGLWPRPSAEATHLAIFANSSQAGRQAAAMAEASAPNAIALSAEAATFLQDSYDLKPLEPGRDRRLPAAVLNLGRARGDHQIPVGFPTTSKELIGRATERVQLEAWLDNRRGGVCYLEAEAGMGKTRLVEHLVSHAKPDLHVLTGKCEPYRNGVSYAPLVDMLSGVQTPDTPASRQLQCMLGLRPPANASERALVDLEPPDLRGELFGCVHEHLATLCFERPVLLIVEDVHWLDLSTLDLIEFLLPFVLDAPIKLLLVARAEMPGPHRALIRKAARVSGDRYMQVNFGGLSEPDSMALMRDLLQTPSLPVGLWPLLTKCAGHPLSLEESLRYLIEHGWLLRVGQNWQLAKHVGALPSEFRDLLLGRLERLDGETLHVLQAAAVLGEMFERAVLNRVAPGSDLSRRLRELEERGWLLAVNDRRTQYRFKHTLTREIIYATLLASKRQVLHQRAGEALEALYQDADEHVELLAQHFAGSALREKSIRYQVQAGQKSAARQALAEALAFYQGALESLNGAASPWRLQIALGLADVHLARGEPNSIIEALTQLLDDGLTPAQRAACLLRLGAAQRDIGELDAALQHFTAALELAPKQERPALLLGRAQTHFDRHELEAAESYALQVLEDTGPGLHAEALGLLGGIAYRRGDIQTAADHVAQSLALHRGRGNRGGAAAAYANLGVLAAMRDDPVAARDNFTLSLELRTALGDAHGTAVVCNNLGQLEQKSGNLEAAGQYLERAIKIARHAELARVLVQSLANLGAVQTEAGQLEAAKAYLDEAETLGRRYGFDDLRYETLCHRAAWAVEVGDYVTAEHDAREALAGAQDLEAVDLVAKVRRVLEHIPQGSDLGADTTATEFDADSVERGQ
ncbi:MAG: tetratricopeptide repeat protein, partial [Anaerolineales bacterium]